MAVLPKSRLIILGVSGAVIILGALVFLGIIPGLQTPGEGKPVPLTVWGPIDSEDTVTRAAQGLNYQIAYERIDPAKYESTLVNALASGEGPDVFMVHSSWLPKHFAKLLPAPAAAITGAAFDSLYPTVATQDFAPDGIVYALPLYIDTLTLFYNKDLFDSAGIAVPPKTWVDFETLVPKLRGLDATGKIVRAAAGIGGSAKSVAHESDILSLLFLQSGVQMVSSDFSKATFGDTGLQTLKFYTKFANPVNPSFTWTDSFGHSLDAFANGSSAMAIAYGSDAPLFRAKNPFLRFGASSVPQPSGATLDVNYASYWAFGVSKKASNPAAAWNFVLSFAADPAHAASYAALSGRLPALRSLIQQKLTDPASAIPAKAALSARSWPKVDSTAVDQAFSGMVEQVTTGQATPETAIKAAEAAISNLMAKPN